MNELLANFYKQLFLTLVFTGVFIYIVYKKVRLIKWENAPKESRKSMKRNQKK
ncbi:hypothetical protein [Enterococcus sp. LJL51]|uniref:hypothetical protein n=1 Tax=Enterococcus sp. LJL51 TaxID=3416656 RepID=UPI003CE67099